MPARETWFGVVGLLTCLVLAACSDKGPPNLEIANLEYHFGSVQPGTEVKHSFTLRNSGKGKLIIEQSTANSTELSYEAPREVLPGKEKQISLALDTSQLQGNVLVKVFLQTNDPARPRLELHVKGYVLLPIDLSPQDRINFDIFTGESAAQTITITNYTKKPLKITALDYESQRGQAQLKTIKEGQEYQLEVKLNPQPKPGKFKEFLFLITNNADLPEIRVPITMVVKPHVFAVPNLLFFGKLDSAEIEERRKDPRLLEEYLSRTIKIKRKPGKGDLQIGIEHKIPFLTIKKVPSGSEAYQLEASLIPEKLPKGKFLDIIRLKTNDKEVPELKIPVAGEVL